MKRMIVHFSFFIAFLFHSTGCFSNEETEYLMTNRYRKLTVDDGLPSGKIKAILQDHQGFMWFGTTNGLSRYDGYSFQNFSDNFPHNNHMPDNLVLSLEMGTGCSIWVGTYQGLAKYDTKKDCFSSLFPSSIPESSFSFNVPINDLALDNSGILWLATSNGLVAFDTKLEQYTSVFSCEISHLPHINRVLVKDNVLWIGTKSNLFRMNLSDYKITEVATDSISDVTSLFSDKNDNLWVGTLNNGLFRINENNTNETTSFTIQSGHLLYNRITSIVDKNDSTLCITTGSGGLYTLNIQNEKFELEQPDLYSEHSLSTRSLTCVYRSSDGNLWLGTLKSGVNYIDYNEKSFTHYKVNYKSNGLTNNNVRSLFADDEDNIWIGTKEGGCLSRFNKQTESFIHLQPNEKNRNALNSDYISAIAQFDANHLLIGTLGKGLSIFNKHTRTFIVCPNNTNKGLDAHCIYKIMVDRNHKVWVATKEKLFVFDFKSHSFRCIKNLTWVRALCEDLEGNIWVGTLGNGVYKLFPDETIASNYQFQKDLDGSIAGNIIFDIVTDKKGGIWIATNKGISNYEGDNRFSHYNTSNGLPNNTICKILVDNKNHIWMSTEQGISHFDRDKREFINYDKSDGLQGNVFESFVGCSTQNGMLLFGGSNGFNLFNPLHIKNNPHSPILTFTHLTIGNKEILANDSTLILTNNITHTSQITLDYKQNDLSIEFSTLSYSSPEKNEYAYQLVGYDNNWIYSKTRRRANYTNLPPGNYTFRVKACNNDGVWNEEGILMSIVIDPPYWETWWFKITLLLFFMFLLVGTYKLRVRLLKQQKRKLESIVLERTQSLELANIALRNHKDKIEIQKEILEEKTIELKQLNKKMESVNKMKLQFFTNISHEFRTPLTLLLVPLERLIMRSQPIGNDNSDVLLKVMKQNGNRLLHLINRLLDFRQIENKSMEYRPEATELIDYTRKIAQAFNELAIQQEIAFNFASNIECCILPVDRAKMEMILYNLISNAFQYTPKKGSILIRIEQENCNKVHIRVEDSGVGMHKEQLSHIFERFMQIENSESTRFHSSGIGLALTKELVHLHGAVLQVDSQLGEGSTFSVTLKCETQGYKIKQRILENTLSANNKEQLSRLMDKLDNHENRIILEETQTDETKLHLPLLLIVDDNRSIQHLIALELNEKYRIIFANNGKEGIKRARKTNPDIIISDVVMPQMDGLAFCAELKSTLETSHIPVLLLTAYASQGNHEKGLRLGADQFLEKPFKTKILIATVDNLIQSRLLLRERFERNLTMQPSEITVNDTDEEFITQLLEILEKEISNSQFSVIHLSTAMRLSKGTVYRKIQSLTSFNPSGFIREFRLKRAAQLLKSGKLRVAEVQYMVGYESKSAFSAAFKKRYGLSPTQYYDEKDRTKVEFQNANTQRLEKLIDMKL